MAESVWKYELPMVGDFDLQLPEGAEIIHVEEQGPKPCLWARVDINAPLEARRLCIRGTGHPFNGGEGDHIRSFFVSGGSLVFHLFERLP